MIEATDLQKSFKLYQTPSDRLKEIVLRRPFHTVHHALKNLSFKVNTGETLGIIGRNGAGKSTLLKILNGVLIPDSGTLNSHGRVTGLLELGTGFNTDMTGLQNIRTNGLLLGMTDTEIHQRKQQIIDFTELGHFIKEPLRVYSSGMIMRLAFAIAIHADPDTFLIDEALSVGDGRFQQKCMRRIKEFRQKGGSIIFVSHDLNAVKMICDRVIVLHQGQVMTNGDPESAINLYNQILAESNTEEVAIVDQTKEGYGSYSAKIMSAVAKGAHSKCAVITSGEEMLLDVSIKGFENHTDLTLGMMIRDRFGQDIFGTNTHFLEYPITVDDNEICTIRIRSPITLSPGKYTITLALHEGPDHTKQCYHWWDNAVTFEVSGILGHYFNGICSLPITIEELEK